MIFRTGEGEKVVSVERLAESEGGDDVEDEIDGGDAIEGGDVEGDN